MKTKTPVLSLEEGKKLKSVAVNLGGATESFLKERQFKNLDSSLGSRGSVRKLFAGRIDAWFGSEKVSRYATKQEKHELNEIVCSGDFAEPAYWLAASLKMSDEDFNKIQVAFRALEKCHFVEKTLSHYLD